MENTTRQQQNTQQSCMFQNVSPWQPILPELANIQLLFLYLENYSVRRSFIMKVMQYQAL